MNDDSDASIELHDVQAIVLRGYRYGEVLPHLYLGFVGFADADAAAAFVGGLAPLVTSCADWDAGHDGTVINLGLTSAGVQRLGQDLAPFPRAFVEGMRRRSSVLGDLGASAPEHWDAGYRDDDLHAVVFVQGATVEALQRGQQRLQALLEATPGASLRYADEGHAFTDSDASEHFGFRDGIGQPSVEGSGLPARPGEGTPERGGKWAPIKAGAFVLGLPDEMGHNDFPELPFRNGSYIALRKLEQKVTQFREFTERMAASGSGNPTLEAARMMGRWPSGAPLDLSPEQDDPTLADDPQRNNDFRYSGDAAGLRCPHGAHVRRANPRACPTGPALQQVREHRILRHGIPYGPWLPIGAPDDGVSRGIFLLAINADLALQFEYVQQNWIDGTLSSTALSARQDKDPIAGSNDGTGKFLAPGKGLPTIGWDLPRFVEVRGGAYLFVPSVSVVRGWGAVAAAAAE